MLLLDGKKLSDDIKQELKVKVGEYKAKTGKVPGLSVIIVGEDPASQVYVRNKAKSCLEIGMTSEVIALPVTTSQDEVLQKIEALNQNPDVHGILVQQPLPKQIDEFAITLAIKPEKDVDGFHPENVGKLVIGRLDECFVSCTPYGIIEIIKRYNIQTKGKHCVIVGRSNIVGKPMANLMVQKLEHMNSTVTVCHSATPNIGDFTRQADILIAAIGKAEIIKGDMIKPGAVVIDVGINRVDDPSAKKGYKLVGDVDFEAASKVGSAVTPVPGGVGPMTISMLLSNTLKSFERHNGLN